MSEDFYDPRYQFEVGIGPAEVREAARFFQSRADSVLNLVGDSAPSKSPFEGLLAYRRRLGTALQECTTGFCGKYGISTEIPADEAVKADVAAALAVWKQTYFPAVDWSALRTAEDKVITAGNWLYKRSTGKLRECTRRDHSGRESTVPYGNELEAWLPFCNGDLRGRIDSSLCTGPNGPEARALEERNQAHRLRADAALAREEARAAAGVSV